MGRESEFSRFELGGPAEAGERRASGSPCCPERLCLVAPGRRFPTWEMGRGPLVLCRDPARS